MAARRLRYCEALQLRGAVVFVVRSDYFSLRAFSCQIFAIERKADGCSCFWARFVGSLLLYYFWNPQNFTNYGDLIPAVPLAGVTIPARHGEPLRVDEFGGKWIFLMTDSGHCDDYCESKLYVMRQIRLTQGKDQQRIERVWLIPDGVLPPQSINAAYRGTRTILSTGDDFIGRLPASDSARDHIYLIDP